MTRRAVLCLTVLVVTLAVAAGWQANAVAAPPDSEAAILQARLLDLPRDDLPVVVNGGFDLTTLHRIDDNAETFEFSGVLTLTWDDPRQAFDAEAEGVAEKIYNGDFQFNRISPSWYPQVVIQHAAHVDTQQGLLLRVTPDGRSTITQPIHAVVRSRLDLKRYPFDNQRLEAVFRVLGFDASEVALSVAGDLGRVGFEPVRVPQWDLVGVQTTIRTVETSGPDASKQSSAFVVALDVERRSFFMVRLVVVPLALIVMLAWCVFWMDTAALGERMSVSFVGILTAVSYQVLVSGALPRIAYVTFVNAFLSFSFLVMCLTAFINVLVAGMHRRGEIERSKRLDRRCRWLFPLGYAVLIAIGAAYAFL